jgi:hypothetical protein
MCCSILTFLCSSLLLTVVLSVLRLRLLIALLISSNFFFLMVINMTSIFNHQIFSRTEKCWHHSKLRKKSVKMQFVLLYLTLYIIYKIKVMFLQSWYPRETSLLFTGRQMWCSISVQKCMFLHSGITILTGS